MAFYISCDLYDLAAVLQAERNQYCMQGLCLHVYSLP